MFKVKDPNNSEVKHAEDDEKWFEIHHELPVCFGNNVATEVVFCLGHQRPKL